MDMVPRFLGDPAQRREPADPGIDIEHVDPAIGGLDLRDHFFVRSDIGNVGAVPGAPRNARDRRVDRRLVAAGQVNLPAFGREGLRRGEAHPAIPAKHEDDLVPETHRPLLKR